MWNKNVLCELWYILSINDLKYREYTYYTRYRVLISTGWAAECIIPISYIHFVRVVKQMLIKALKEKAFY